MTAPSEATKEQIVAAIRSGDAVVCYAKCWPCNFGQCPGGWHTWADADDIEHAAKTGQADPSAQRCGCPCVDEPEREAPQPPSMDESLDVPPCFVCGAPGACSYDSEGRPLIHAEPDDEAESDA